MSFCCQIRINVQANNKGQTDKRKFFLCRNATAERVNSDDKKAYLPASATVEAALVMPLYIYAVMAVIYILQIVLIRREVSTAAYNSLRTMSKYTYSFEKLEEKNETISLAALYALMIGELGTDFASKNNIVGGNAGLIIANSELLNKGNELKLVLQYAVRNPFDIFGIGIINVKQECSVQAWLGENSSSFEKNPEEEWVYITEQGSVYHTICDCTYINLVTTEMGVNEIEGKRNASGGKYYPCEKCAVNIKSETVFITSYGNRYHVSPNCSRLKRFVMRVPFSSVENRKCCSKCGGN